ncbi:MAG: maleylpyruvate isomerase family mycothiol-dependent enzyme [Nocardioides sp.]|nr:maleylpyruvate isomerase family mycothiol-dependent enzyme [Nocardioides sp.]
MNADPGNLDLIDVVDATSRYLQSLASLDDGDLRAASLLPGWTRGHVAAHLARNADAMTNAVTALHNGTDVFMYSSQEARDAEVESGAGRSAEEMIEDTRSACERLVVAVEKLSPALYDAAIPRVPGGEGFLTPRDLPSTRRREVIIHHTDLGAGFTPSDWPLDFAAAVVTHRHRDLADGGSMVLTATDTGDVWKFGSGGGPSVSAPAAELAWWLVGRGDGSALECSAALPTIARWR